MLEAFRLGGWAMFPTLVVGLLLLAAAARYAVKPEARWVPLQIALAVLTLTSGLLGCVSGVIVTIRHLSELPTDRTGVMAIGVGESLNNIALALLLLMLAALLTSVGAVRLTRAPA